MAKEDGARREARVAAVIAERGGADGVHALIVERESERFLAGEQEEGTQPAAQGGAAHAVEEELVPEQLRLPGGVHQALDAFFVWRPVFRRADFNDADGGPGFAGEGILFGAQAAETLAGAQGQCLGMSRRQAQPVVRQGRGQAQGHRAAAATRGRFEEEQARVIGHMLKPDCSHVRQFPESLAQRLGDCTGVRAVGQEVAPADLQRVE